MIHKSPAISVYSLSWIFSIAHVGVRNKKFPYESRLPSMSIHTVQSVGNNLTASCKDMQDDFQLTFNPFSFLDEEGASTKHLHVPSLLQQHYRFMLKMT